MRLIPILALAALTVPATAQNLITNGTFEDGSSIPWITGFPNANSGFATMELAHTGGFSLKLPANAVPIGGGSALVVPGIEEQAFQLTEGRLLVSFWGYSELDIPGPSFGITLYGPEGFGPDVFLDAKPGWNLYSYKVPVDSAITQFDHLRLTSWTNNPSAVFNAYIDDVTVQPVPEPASILAFALGIGVCARRCHKTRHP